MRLVFAGTPEPAVPSLRRLLASPHHDLVAVLSRPDAVAGRGRRVVRSPVATLADEAGVPVLTPDRASDPEFLAELAALEPDCCPVVAYGALLRPAALDVPAHGWVNLHFSLLPAWRGAAPVQAAIRAGDEVTGASTFRIEAGLDTGPVYGVLTEEVRGDDTAGALLGRLAEAGASLLEATLDGIAAGALDPVPQPADGVSHAPKLTPELVRVRWGAPAVAVDRAVRAATPDPGAWTQRGDVRLKLGPVTVEQRDDLAPGELAADRRGVSVGTATTAVRLGDVQAPGGRPLPAADWARGARLEAGERLS